MYIYIYIYRERERERESTFTHTLSLSHTHIVLLHAYYPRIQWCVSLVPRLLISFDILNTPSSAISLLRGTKVHRKAIRSSRNPVSSNPCPCEHTTSRRMCCVCALHAQLEESISTSSFVFPFFQDIYPNGKPKYPTRNYE